MTIKNIFHLHFFIVLEESVLLKTFFSCILVFIFKNINIQGVIEMLDQILTTSYWLHVELGKNI
jgi:hypothetical protein